MSLKIWSIIMFALFLGSMVITGIMSARKSSKGTGSVDEEYYLGGRNTGPVMLAFSYVTGSVSAAAFMGEPGLMSQVGWSYYWIVIAIIPGMVFPALLLMKKLRTKSEELGSLTIPQYLGQHYKSDGVRIVIAIAICVFYLFPLVAQFKGAAVLLESFTNIPFNAGILIFTVFIGFYVAFGGLNSVVLASFIQGIPMFFIAIVLVVTGLKAVGGFEGIEIGLNAIDPSMLNVVEARGPDSLFPVEGIIGVFFYWAIMFVSQPYLAARFMSIKDTSKKTIGTFLIVVLVLTVALNTLYFTGLAGRILYPDLPGDYITSQLAIDYLPTVLAAIMMIGIFGAMMSTTQSMLLVVAQAVANDLYVETINPKASGRAIINITRAAVGVVSIIVLILTWLNPPEFLSIFLYLGLSGIGSSIAVPLFASLMWPGATKQGALASCIVGPLAYILFEMILNWNLWFSSMMAVILAAIAMYVLSKIYATEKVSKTIEA